uniref:Tektin n=1 Tax=Echinococcus granulosus TaxID=6210 RepID=A0A068WJ94_ECHGR|nr:tektin 1 [Echinococcus granulosus]
MSEAIKAPRMFTPCEWLCSNRIKHSEADAARESAQNVAFENEALMNEIKDRTIKTMQDVDEKLDQRITDISFWMSELTKKIKDNANESDKLISCIVRLKKALEATTEPLYLSEKCITIRQARKGSDFVADNAHNELVKEIAVFNGVRALLTRGIEQTEEQLRLNRKSAFNLKSDFRGKETAKNRDEYAKTISTYDNIPEVTKCYPAPVSMDEWLLQLKKNLEEADRQIQNSRQTRSLVEGVLIQVFEDQKEQVDATNRAIQIRVGETRDAKRKLEEHLSLIFKEIPNMEDNIRDIKKLICDTLKSAEITETKTNIRDCRPLNELCRDAPHYRMLKQIEELKTDISTLRQMLHDAEEELKALRRRQLDLEEEIQNKTNSLHIEEVRILEIRSSISIEKF